MYSSEGPVETVAGSASRRDERDEVLADAYDAFLFDLDGVLYRGDEAIRRTGGDRTIACGGEACSVRHEQLGADA